MILKGSREYCYLGHINGTLLKQIDVPPSSLMHTSYDS